jgi:hypothetical protein
MSDRRIEAFFYGLYMDLDAQREVVAGSNRHG